MSYSLQNACGISERNPQTLFDFVLFSVGHVFCVCFRFWCMVLLLEGILRKKNSNATDENIGNKNYLNKSHLSRIIGLFERRKAKGVHLQ